MELVAIHQGDTTSIVRMNDLNESSQTLSVTGILKLWRKESVCSDQV